MRASLRALLPIAVACLVAAPLGIGCSNSSAIDPDIKVVEGPKTQELTKDNPAFKGSKVADRAPE
jgi:hypothetical protein